MIDVSNDPRLIKGLYALCPSIAGHWPLHGTEVLPFMCPEISRDTAASIASFVMSL